MVFRCSFGTPEIGDEPLSEEDEDGEDRNGEEGEGNDAVEVPVGEHRAMVSSTLSDGVECYGVCRAPGRDRIPLGFAGGHGGRTR